MEKVDIEKLTEKFGWDVLRWHPESVILNEGGRFVLRTAPLPPPEEIMDVIADVEEDRPVRIIDGKLHHSPNCPSLSHNIRDVIKKRIITKALPLINNENFVVAIHPGTPQHQPIPTAIDPQINYDIYPDHPHLGIMGYDPDSICFVDDHTVLGNNDYDRIRQTVGKVIIWLFRHQIWVATKKISGTGIWIGPQCPRRNPAEFPGILNPNGLCHCGSDKTYINCHMHHDVANKYNCSLTFAKQYLNRYVEYWNDIQVHKVVRFNRLMLDIKMEF